jgi:SAM-dependent methyltransferase
VSHVHDRLRDWWDADAHVYDASAGHAMSDPVEAAAWRAVLVRSLPPAPARVLDVGAGTGALALLAADLGHDVTALDLSEGMLAKARAKADAGGHRVAFVHGPAEHPPPGPFDAVMERHVSWTLPDPVRAFRAWREVTAPGGHLILLEGSWAGEGPWVAAKDVVAGWLERVLGVEDDHHAPYPQDVLDALPLRRTTSPSPFIEAVWEAGWTRVRIARLRDVEWAIEQREPWPLGWLGHRPRYAIVAER